MLRANRRSGRLLAQVVHVDRQLVVTVSGPTPFLAPPKTSASARTIPLPTVAIDAVAAHLAAFPPLGDVSYSSPTLGSRSGGRRSVASGEPPSRLQTRRLGPASTSSGTTTPAADQTQRERQGSASATRSRIGAETLDTYSHLWPDSDDRTRTAVDSVLSADYVRTEGVVDGRTP